jgi:hypothetical protein
MENLQSLTFKMGGIYTEKKDILVAGRIATIWENDFSDKVFKMFSSKIKKYFKKIDSFYVGKEANDMLLSGWRLVTNEKLASGFDLKS